MDWRGEYKRKLVSAEEAVKVIKDGDQVVIPLVAQPIVLPRALGARANELSNVSLVLEAGLSAPSWAPIDWPTAFNVIFGQYTGANVRHWLIEGKADFWSWAALVLG